MKRSALIPLAIMILFLLPCIGNTVEAGVEPSPFRSHLNKLQSIDKNLEVEHSHLSRILSSPPENDDKGQQGSVGQLGGVENHLSVLDRRLEIVLEEIEEEDDTHGLFEVMAFLSENLLYRARVVEREMLDFLSLHSNDMDKFPQEFLEGFFDVGTIINNMADRIEEFLGTPTIPSDG